MRSAPFVVALLMVVPLFAAAFAGAQAAGPMYEDAEGDTQFQTFDVPGAPAVPVNNAETQSADLLAFNVVEHMDALVMTLAVKSLESTVPYQTQYSMSFVWGKSTQSVQCYRVNLAALGADEDPNCRITAFSAEEGFLDGAEVQGSFDAAAATLTVTVPKVYVLDEEERAPTRGDTLTHFEVRSVMYISLFGVFTRVTDYMPDDASLASMQLQIGDEAKGHITLTTADRVRVSNGGATTFVFRANLTNAAEIGDSVRLTAMDLPQGWNVTIQSPIDLPAESSREIGILVSVPFAHDHGGFTAFNLSATSTRDTASYATLRLGILHTPIPQPAGHHDELYLHSANPYGGIFSQTLDGGFPSMNTQPPTEADATTAQATDGADGIGWVWDIPLDPTLRMGLDFDVEGVGNVAGTMIPRIEGTGTLHAALVLVEVETDEDEFGGRMPRYLVDEGVVLAEGMQEGLTMTLNGETAFDVPLTPTDASDYVAYKPRQNLVLRLTLESDGVGGFCCISDTTGELNTADFIMKLPLNEYHDKLTGVAEAALALDLKAIGDVEKPARPGTIVTYEFSLTNPLADAIAMEIDVAGGNADRGTVVPDGLVEVPANGAVKVTLAVKVPPEAAEGEQIEVLVFAHARDDPSKMVIGRTKTIVTLGSGAVADETDKLIAAQQEAAENDTPAPSALLALATLGAVALLARRRR